MSRIQQLIVHRKGGGPIKSNGKGSGAHIQIVSEDWPLMDDIAAPSTPPSAGAATYSFLSELRDMDMVFPPFVPPTPSNVPAAATTSAQEEGGGVTSPATNGSKVSNGGQEFFHIAGSPYRYLRVRLPTANELPTFPTQLGDHFKEVAVETLRVMLYPRVLLRIKQRQRIRALESVDAHQQPKLSTAMVTSTPLFRSWPAEAVQAVIREATWGVYEAREYIAYQGELPAAAYFIASGTCKLLTRSAPQAGAQRNKRFTSSNCASTTMAVSPTSYGFINLLTNEPLAATLRSIGKVDVFSLSRENFNKVLAQVPQHVTMHTISTAFERRNERMTSVFPVTVDDLRANKLFSGVSSEFAQLIVDKLEPHAIPSKFTFLKGGEACDAMYFIRSGRVEVSKPLDDASLNASTSREATVSVMSSSHPSVVAAPVLVGDSAVMYSSASEYTVAASTDCDAYVLSKHVFTLLCRQHPAEVDIMLDAARDQRKAELRDNHTKFRALITHMPIIRDVIPHAFERHFLNLFTPRSYRPMSCVCSTSNFCDRIMVLTKGKMTIDGSKGVGGHGCKGNIVASGEGAEVHDGSINNTRTHTMRRWESIGWSCVVPHRWGFTAMALGKTVETLELPYLDFMLFLHERGLLDRVTHMVKVLMFPRAFPAPVGLAIRREVGPHVIMYPISNSTAVNLYEIGYCSVHMSALESDQHHRENKVDIGDQGSKGQPSSSSASAGGHPRVVDHSSGGTNASNTVLGASSSDAEALLARRIVPPQYRRLSKGVWVPQLLELKKKH